MELIIVQFRVFDKDLEKVFYNNETAVQIHQALKEIGFTYMVKDVIVSCRCKHSTSINLLEEIKLHSQDES